MTRHVLAACIALGLVATGMEAGAETSSATPAASVASATPRAARSNAATAAARHRRTAVPKHAAAKPTAPAPGMPRTLEDVHIEGEVPVPQVLFITARDQRRFMDFQHHRYLETSAQLGAATPFPTWVAVTHGSPADSRKEPSR